VIMTAQGSIRSAVEAVRAGAIDYLTKPVPLEDLERLVARALELRQAAAHAAEAEAGAAAVPADEEPVGISHGFQHVLQLARQIAPTQASVLITGESGTGKDLLARTIHRLSPRAGAPFVKVSCAALPEALLESELFGHERGAFTGALARRPGRFEVASGGTIFLDEVGDIPAAMQVKLLRFLQDHEFERVGGNRTLTVDVRVLAATHRDLAALVRDGSFRDDLYWRLNVIELRMPALRERAEDIPLLARHFVARCARANGRVMDQLGDDVLRTMRAYAWPGNVRELENAVERAVVLSRGPRLGLDLFPSLTGISPAAAAPFEPPSIPPIPGATLEEIEREAILRTLESVGGSSTRAAAILRISPRTIQYKRKQWMTDAPAAARLLRVQRQSS
jgi:DNA-binding NtrC family response regulator